MSSAQMKKLVLIIVGMLIVMVGVIAGIFLFDTSGSDSDDIEVVKAAGNYEGFKNDLINEQHLRDSQAASVANIFFEKMGIKKYEGMNSGTSRHGNLVIKADGFNLDCLLRAGDLYSVYIGEVLVYKNPDKGVTASANTLEYSYEQYTILVDSFIKSLKVDEQVGKDIYEEMTILGIRSFTDVKKGKLNGVKGYYGKEGEFPYFLIIENNRLSKIYVTCDGFDPIEVYNTSGKNEIKNTKVLLGPRQGIANVLGFKVKQVYGKEVMFPAALLTGDDSWLMVKNNDIIYIEVSGEIIDGEKRKTEDFVIKINENNDIQYLKVGRKEIVK